MQRDLTLLLRILQPTRSMLHQTRRVHHMIFELLLRVMRVEIERSRRGHLRDLHQRGSRMCHVALVSVGTMQHGQQLLQQRSSLMIRAYQSRHSLGQLLAHGAHRRDGTITAATAESRAAAMMPMRDAIAITRLASDAT